MSIDSSIVLGFGPTAEFACCRHERFDDMLAQRQKRADSANAYGSDYISAGLAHSFDNLFVSKLQEVIRCLPCCVLRIGASRHLLNLGGKIHHAKASGFWSSPSAFCVSFSFDQTDA